MDSEIFQGIALTEKLSTRKQSDLCPFLTTAERLFNYIN